MFTHKADLVIPYPVTVRGLRQLRQAKAVVGHLIPEPPMPEDKWVSAKMFILGPSGLPSSHRRRAAPVTWDCGADLNPSSWEQQAPQ